ncbi:hypothetical protein HNR00_000942 [Methylorubrum rhodinum]|uniref:Uncharacterized protein n=1 Tax=Methylorubrum rhodinum TaxID=29428 RepID=A0A840ZGA5_9HYPH|nr:hypothetical protein [Methylorubrum rhodinum]MBB5756244.1 hypothetical protein [Methylorubrum rhodinum]
MIETVNLLPPGFGPRADPLLFGVSEGLLRLFPLPAADQRAAGGGEVPRDARPDSDPAPVLAAAEA